MTPTEASDSTLPLAPVNQLSSPRRAGRPERSAVWHVLVFTWAGLAVAVHDENDRSLRSHVGELSTLQKRFEESRVGKIAISALVVLIVIVGVTFNLPDSPIKRSLLPVVEPVAAPLGLDQSWAMYANPSRRVDNVEVHVSMANGENRVWTMQPGERGVSWWDRWLLLRYATVLDAKVRPQLAHWVVREITEPSEQPVGVSIILRTETLPDPDEQPGKNSRRSSAVKILYQESLAGPR